MQHQSGSTGRNGVVKTAKAQSLPQNAPILTEVFGPMWLARVLIFVFTNLIPYDAMDLRMEAMSNSGKEDKVSDGSAPPSLSELSAASGFGNTMDYVRSLLVNRISTFSSSAGWFRKRYYLSTMSTVVLSGLVTILAGLKLYDDRWTWWSSATILVLGATSTIFSAWGAFFAPRESWHLYATTLGKLRALHARLEFDSLRIPHQISDDDALQIFNEYQQILDTHNAQWLAIRMK
jgi:hypothetical protein